MWISRVQVSEGFLDGVDIALKRGFNVLIGARGTGKTSVIELIRFCLDAPLLTEAARTTRFQQAISVLAGGRVTVTLVDGNRELIVSRQAEETAQPGEHLTGRTPLVVLAQNEIEAIAARGSGRLALIDRLLPDVAELNEKEMAITAELRSLTEEAAGVLQEGLQLNDTLDALADVPDLLSKARTRQAELLQRIAATSADRNALAELQATGGRLAAQLDVLTRGELSIERWVQTADQLASAAPGILEPWPEAAGPLDALNDVRTELQQATALIEQLRAVLRSAAASAIGVRQATESGRLALEEQSSGIRVRLELLEGGASELTRQVTILQERNGQRDSVQGRIKQRRATFRQLFEVRRKAYELLDDVRSQRYALRQQTGEDLNRTLMPTIRVAIRSSEETSEYASAIVSALRGSGLHYNNLAPSIAQRMAPIELVEAVEMGDTAAIAAATGISTERANALIAALRTGGLANIVAANLQDGVSIQLLDGVDYKPSDELSIGQRCTVVLPILLAARRGILLIDQPEDHLDNAFVASTLVASLRGRGSDEQYIFSSHNANLPVLGEADQVIHLGSNGRHAYILSAGGLAEPRVVEAISTVMEGGMEAFDIRARFYGEDLL